MCGARHAKPVLRENLQGRAGEGGASGVQDGGDTCAYKPIHSDVWQKRKNQNILN